MKVITKEARGFVSGVLGYLRRSPKGGKSVGKMKVLMHKITAQAKSANTAWVESPVLLSHQESEKLAQILSRLVGHVISVEIRRKPELLGGLKIQIADWVIDASIASQLKALSGSLVSE